MSEHIKALADARDALAAAMPADPAAATVDDLAVAVRAAGSAVAAVAQVVSTGPLATADAARAPLVADLLLYMAQRVALLAPDGLTWAAGWGWVGRVCDLVDDALRSHAQAEAGRRVAQLPPSAFGL